MSLQSASTSVCTQVLGAKKCQSGQLLNFERILVSSSTAIWPQLVENKPNKEIIVVVGFYRVAPE